MEENFMDKQDVMADQTSGKDSRKNILIKERIGRSVRWMKSWWMFFAILLLWIGIMQYVVAEKYSMTVNVVGENKEVSAQTTTDGLDFGTMIKGNSSTRFITIENKGSRDMYVKVYKLGGISSFVEVSRDDFILPASESENLEFLLSVPSGAKEKEYTGRIFVFEIPKIL